MNPMQNSKISAGTIARTACLALALANQILSACGKPVLPVDNETVETFLTTALTVGAAVWSWWKNNSFSKEAIEADEIMHAQKERAKMKM